MPNAEAHNNAEGSSQHQIDQTEPIVCYSNRPNNKPNIKYQTGGLGFTVK